MFPFIMALEGNAQEAGSTLSSVVTQEMLQGVLNEVVALLPTCMPVLISFIAIRKGIGFVRGILQSA